MIKGVAALRCFGSSRLGFLEQLIGGIEVGRGSRHMRFDAGDLTLQDVDAFIELVNRQRAEVLLDDLRQRILRAAREEIILIHRGRQR